MVELTIKNATSLTENQAKAVVLAATGKSMDARQVNSLKQAGEKVKRALKG